MRGKIIFTVLGIVISLAMVGKATPMGTAWTYQGRLMDANKPADGLYDFQFKLFDDPHSNIPITEVNVADIDIMNGYFTAELDFGGSVFDGDACWLEIGIRPGELADPNDYITLSSRQMVTPTPYALYAESAGSDSDWTVTGQDIHAAVTGNVGIGVMMPNYKLDVDGDIKGTSGRFGTDLLDYGANLQVANRINIMDKMTIHPSLYIGDSGTEYLRLFWNSTGDYGQISTRSGHNLVIMPGGNMGIGTLDPEETLDVRGNLEVDNTIKAHDADGLEFATHEADIRMKITDNGNVGIGTTNPSEKLEVKGNIDVSSNNIKRYYGFPRPNYDSGWVPIDQGEDVTLTHGLGGDVDNYVVDMQFKNTASMSFLGINCLGYGYYNSATGTVGGFYYGLGTNTIEVQRALDDSVISDIRIRIWVYD